MEKYNIVPDVLKSVPKDTTEIIYGSNKVSLGNVLTPTQVKKTPSVKWAYDDKSFYTLVMVDPDAPSRKNPKYREWLHWMVVNIPERNLKEGEIIAEYVGAGPPKGTGLHRYVTAVYKQPKKTSFDEARISRKSAQGRANYSHKKFTERHNMELVSGNFFQAEYDDYVPTLHKQLRA